MNWVKDCQWNPRERDVIIYVNSHAFLPFPLYRYAYKAPRAKNRIGKAQRGEFIDCWTKWGSWREAPPKSQVGELERGPT